MRLSTIKLAGFKSFVDPTVLHLPSNLIGVVGPNGCGKSNIIDAVRWVMGESSARSLRGETMSDVIFNGSASRKPVGQAAIELVFDNSQGRLGGPWAGYTEIAIKRLVSRDGQSSYFLNGTRCRRRDIADIFLGTGLGPRSYAIIEQGMISRVIEARAEELRVFLEEAAGISKYKERRRETEMRIRHARENLDRLNDVREELNRQLQHLQRQARAAEQYRDLRAEECQLRVELLSLRWRGLQADIHEHDRRLRQRETALEAVLAEQRHLEAMLEAGRLQRAELNDAFNAAQGRYYQVGAEISRIEHALQHQRALRQRWEADELQIETARAHIDAQSTLDQQQQGEWTAALAVTEPTWAQALTAEAEAGAALAITENALYEGQAAWEAFNRQQSEALRQADVERTRLEHLDRQSLHSEQRRERLRLEVQQLMDTEFDREVAELETDEQAVAEHLHCDQEVLAQLEAEQLQTREAQRQMSAAVQVVQERLQAGRGRLAALQTLQEAALGRNDSQIGDWLRAQGLAEAPRLAECLEVEPGWERAVEAALAGYLDAVCTPDIAEIAQAISEPAQGHLTLFEIPDVSEAGTPAATSLATQVRAPWPLADWLAGVETVANVAEALMGRTRLQAGETLVTPEGVQCGRHWLRLARGGEDNSVLVREREIHQMEAALNEDTAIMEQQNVQLEALRMHGQDLEQRHREVQKAVNQGHRDHAAIQGRLSAAQIRREQARTRYAALAEELTELDDQSEQEREQIEQARSRLEEVLLVLENLHTEQAQLMAMRERAQTDLQQCRIRAEAARQEVARLAALIESLRVRVTATEQALERLHEQRQQLQARWERLVAERAAEPEAALATVEAELANELERRLSCEAGLHAARQDLETCDAELKVGEQARSHCERQAETQRRDIEEQRLVLSEARVRQQTLCEQLSELASDPETVLSTLPESAIEGDRLTRLDQVERRIQRLGPINLAAIEEFAQRSERKQYLDAQNADLLEALTTLETAIRKIDRETRARFRETFEQVNLGLQELFPRLFGGGQAHLELTGEDVLDAGVAIMAKPPGKRIGSISLMSGGEKALTAVALVFAIFQLNPAPFCLLDEVDAPLDEANVGRFGALVRDMATRVQFIFITHNKATMEIAQHLAGVTMQEPGVSRLVAVDVEEAARLVAVR